MGIEVEPRGRSASVLVIGGGITGLAAAHRLGQLGVETVLLERDARCGGVILTEELEGFLVEAGPDSFLARKPLAADLCRRVGLGDEIIPTDAANRGSFIWLRGGLHPLPEGLTSLVPTRFAAVARTRLLSPAGKARLLAEPLLPRGPELEDESLAGFFRRRIGEEASRRLVEPLVRGIYGGDPERLSLRATFPQLAEIERRRRSLILGLLGQARAAPSGTGTARGGSSGRGRGQAEAAFLSLRRGMGSLVDRLVERLPPGVVRTRSGVAALRRAAGGGFEAALREGGGMTAEAAILATPARETARLLEGIDHELSELVGGIRAGSSVTVALGFDGGRVHHPLRGYGFVVPEDERGPLLACTWASSKFPGRAPPGAVLVRAFLTDAESLLERDDEDVAHLALEALRPILGIEGEPRLARVHRWREALARYAVGHVRRLREIEGRLREVPGLLLAGAAYRGVGIPDCVREGESAAEAARDHLARSAARAAG
jgi:oxygen-dependent protoporphyrinogen oxidase